MEAPVAQRDEQLLAICRPLRALAFSVEQRHVLVTCLYLDIGVALSGEKLSRARQALAECSQGGRNSVSIGAP